MHDTIAINFDQINQENIMTDGHKHRQEKENIKKFVFTDKETKLEIVVPEVRQLQLVL